MKRSTWITALVVIGAIATNAILEATKAEPAPIRDDTQVRVETIRARAVALSGSWSAGGFLRARADITISAERAGRLVELPVAEGADVERHTVVAEIDATAAAANLERARTVLRELQLNAATPATELARAREALALAEDEWNARHPRAPLRGVVEVHHVDVGEYVRPGTPLLDLLDLSTLILDADVDAEAVAVLSVGDSVSVAVRALVASGPLTGRISRIARRADATTRRFRVEVETHRSTEARHRARGRACSREARFTPPRRRRRPSTCPKEAVREVRAQQGVFVVAGEPPSVAWTAGRTVEEVHHRPAWWRVNGVEGRYASIVVEGFAGLREGTVVDAVAAARSRRIARDRRRRAVTGGSGSRDPSIKPALERRSASSLARFSVQAGRADQRPVRRLPRGRSVREPATSPSTRTPTSTSTPPRSTRCGSVRRPTRSTTSSPHASKTRSRAFAVSTASSATAVRTARQHPREVQGGPERRGRRPRLPRHPRGA